MQQLLVLLLLAGSIETRAAESLVVVMPLVAADPADRLGEADLTKLERSVRTATARDLKPLHYTVMPREAMVKEYGELVNDRTRCSDKGCRLGLARQLRSDFYVEASLRKGRQGLDLRLSVTRTRTGEVLASETISGKGLAQVARAADAGLKGVIAHAKLPDPTAPAAPQSDLEKAILGERRPVQAATPHLGVAASKGDPIPFGTLTLDTGATLSPQTSGKPTVLLFYRKACLDVTGCTPSAQALSDNASVLAEARATAVLVPLGLTGPQARLSADTIKLPVALDGVGLAASLGIDPDGNAGGGQIVVTRSDGRIGALIPLAVTGGHQALSSVRRDATPLPDGTVVLLKPNVIDAVRAVKAQNPGAMTPTGAEKLRAAILDDKLVDAAEVDLLGEVVAGRVVMVTATASAVTLGPDVTVVGKATSEAQLLLACVDALPEPALAATWDKGEAGLRELVEVYARSAADAARVRLVLRAKVVEGMATARSSSGAIHDFLSRTQVHLGKLSPESAVAARHMLGSLFADLDARVGGAVPDFTYEHLLK